MFSNIRNRLILIAGLILLSVFFLVPRNVTQRIRSPNGTMYDTIVRRVPIKLGLDLQGGIYLALEIDESQGRVQDREDAIDRVLTVIRTRIDEFGTLEPDIQKVGTDRIVVQLAGLDDPERAKQIVQRSAYLEWRITDMQQTFRDALPAIDAALFEAGVRVDETAAVATPSAIEQLLSTTDTQTAGEDTTVADSAEAGAATPPDGQAPLSTYLFNGQIPGEFLVEQQRYLQVDSIIRLDVTQRNLPRNVELFWGSDPQSLGGQSYLPLYAVEDRAVVTGETLTDASATIDQQSRTSIVRFELTRRGGRSFRRETTEHIEDYMAIILDGRVQRQPPIIRSAIGRTGQIELGNVPLQEAQDLALVLRAGALPAKILIVEERSVGPSMGEDSRDQGIMAAFVAAILVLVIMAVYYRKAGFLAIAALAVYVLFTMGGLATLGATLTLPGLAGFVLSLGLAVDANVLIFERIREELKLDKTPRAAIDAGFQHAMPAIIDANITTVVTAAFLFQFGTGSVRGFAVTLIIGIIASLITAVFVTRTLFLIWLQRRTSTQELSI